jgi:hypothetical protein
MRARKSAKPAQTRKKPQRRKVATPTTLAGTGRKWLATGGIPTSIPTTAEWLPEADARIDAGLLLDSLEASAIALVDLNESRSRAAANRILERVDECRAAIRSGRLAEAVAAVLDATGIWWRAAYAVHWLDDVSIGKKSAAGGRDGAKGGAAKGQHYAEANAALARGAKGMIAKGWTRDAILRELVPKDPMKPKRKKLGVERALRAALGERWTNTPRIRTNTTKKPR